MKSAPIVLAQDALLSSERDGTPRIYWAAATTWDAFRDCTALDFEFRVNSVLGSGSLLAIYAQISIDGRVWQDLSNASSGGFLPITTIVVAGDEGRETLWLGGMLSKAAFVRFGVQIYSNVPDAQAEIGLTLNITPRVAAGGVEVANNFAVAPTFVAVGPVVDVRDADAVTLHASALALETAGKTAIFEPYTAPAPDSTSWAPTGITVTVTEGGSVTAISGGDRTKLSSYVQVYETGLGTSTTGNVDMSLTVRPN